MKNLLKIFIFLQFMFVALLSPLPVLAQENDIESELESFSEDDLIGESDEELEEIDEELGEKEGDLSELEDKSKEVTKKKPQKDSDEEKLDKELEEKPLEDTVAEPEDTELDPSEDTVAEPEDTELDPSEDTVAEPEDTELDPSEDTVAEPEDTELDPSEDTVAEPEDTELDPSEETVAEPEEVVAPEPELYPAVEEPLQRVDSGSDQPDLTYESELYDIYKNYHNKQTPQAVWKNIVGDKLTEQYRIQKGDTLWGISQTLFGDGNYWPTIWSANDRITNPHLISEGNTIYFILGSVAAGPSFTIGENQELNQKGSFSTEVLYSQNDEEIEIPRPTFISHPLLKKLPPSLPVWQSSDREGLYDELGFEYVRRPILDIKNSIDLTTYIVDKELEGLGKVSEVEAGMASARLFQYIYFKSKNKTLERGQKLLVVQNLGRLHRVNKFIKGQLGYAVSVQGEIRITDAIRSKKEDEMIYRATVIKQVNPVMVGGLVISDSIKQITVDKKGPRSEVMAQIIGGIYSDRRQLFGFQSFVYLNRGQAHGLEEGQVMPVRANRLVRNQDAEVTESLHAVGWVKVVHAAANYSTAVIVESSEGIYTSDITGARTLADNMPPEEDEILDESEIDFY